MRKCTPIIIGGNCIIFVTMYLVVSSDEGPGILVPGTWVPMLRVPGLARYRVPDTFRVESWYALGTHYRGV